KFKRAVTDSGTDIRFDASRPAITNLLTIYQLLTGKSAELIEANFSGKGYAQLKQELADVTIDFLRPLQEKVAEISDEQLNQILATGRDKAKSIAHVTLNDVKSKLGLMGADK